MMNLIHRNRVTCSRLIRLEHAPLRSNLLANIFPQRGRLFSRILFVKLTVEMKQFPPYPSCNSFIMRGSETSLPRWGRGTAAEDNCEYLEQLSDAVAVDEVHHTDALSHLHKHKNSLKILIHTVFSLLSYSVPYNFYSKKCLCYIIVKK